jgi:hypothetical protein
VIALLSTIICITTIFTKYGDDPELRKSRFKFALSKASVSFFDTLLYFNFMVMIAGIVYVTQAGTIYERVLCVLVSCLTNSASLVLVTVYSYPQEGKSLRQWTQAIGLSLSEPLLIIALLGFEDLDLFPLEDNYCYEGNILPLTAMKVSCWMQVASFILLILGLGLLNVAPYWVKLWSRIRQQPTSGDLAGLESLISLLLGVLVIVLQLVSMWINFYFIAVIREEAKTFFGSSYADNAMGYGQIIASGFCLQAIVQWLYLMWSKSQLTYTPTRALKRPKPSNKKYRKAQTTTIFPCGYSICPLLN